MGKVTQELLPCPFCGSTNIDATGWRSLDAQGPACDDCGSSAGQISLDHADNIRAWNIRTPHADLVEALRGLLARQGHSEPTLADGRKMSDATMVTILCTIGDTRKARKALSLYGGEKP